jgi:DNA-binding MurR/RpiR family transcriptional regulator
MLTAEPVGNGFAAFFACAADAENRAEKALKEMRLQWGYFPQKCTKSTGISRQNAGFKLYTCFFVTEALNLLPGVDKMNDCLTTRIHEKISSFSKGQKLIAKYIMEHYDKVAFMTASRLGTTVGVSESTVVRFATEIGYAGYPELQRAMQEMIRSKLTIVQRMEVTRERIGQDDILDAVMNQDSEVIRRTMEYTSHKEFYLAVDAILASRKIYILGARSCQALASFLAYYFGMLLDDVMLVQATSEAEIFQQLIHINEKDTVIGISFPRYSRKAIKAMQFAQDCGSKVVAITDTAASPLVQYADYALLARSDIAAIVDSLVAPLSLINALIVTIALKKENSMDETFHRLENIWDEYHVYEKVENSAEVDTKYADNA